MFWNRLSWGQKKTIRRLTLLLMFLVLSILLLLKSCSKQKTDLEDLKLKIDSSYTIRTLEVDMLISDSGIVRYRLISPEWLVYDHSERHQWLFPKGIRLETYDSLNNGQTLIVADSAVQHLNTETWELMGNVRATGLDGELLCSPHLFWERQAKNLYSPDTVYLLDNGDVSRGDSLRAKDDLSQYYVYNNSADVTVEEDKQTETSYTNIRQTDSLRAKDSLRTETDRLSKQIDAK